MKPLPHVIVTRHGECVHNTPGNDFLWKEYSNDDIMGLTTEGIAETALKAKVLSFILRRDRRVFVLGTQSFRTQQTASLLASELRRKHGFDRVKWMGHAPISVLNEFPRPTQAKPLHPEFDYSKFMASPYYDVGDGSSFASFFEGLRTLVHTGALASQFMGSSESGHDDAYIKFEPADQVVFVGHHYSVSALIGVLAMEASSASSRSSGDAVETEHFYRKFVEASHSFCLKHSDLLYLTPLFDTAAIAKNRNNHMHAMWLHTMCVLETHIFSKTGLVLTSILRPHEDTEPQDSA